MSFPSAQSSSAADSPPHDRKATLFCPDCGHASPIDGDWTVRTAGGRRRIRCPDCQRVIDRRGADRSSARTSLDAPVRWCADAWTRCLSAWTTLVTGDRSADC